MACLRIFKILEKSTKNGYRSVIDLFIFEDGNNGSLVADGREYSL